MQMPMCQRTIFEKALKQGSHPLVLSDTCVLGVSLRERNRDDQHKMQDHGCLWASEAGDLCEESKQEGPRTRLLSYVGRQILGHTSYH